MSTLSDFLLAHELVEHGKYIHGISIINGDQLGRYVL